MDKDTPRPRSRTTARTLIDAPSEAETHKLDPRYLAPLRVCPQCSLAWETDAEWCASCGTAFDARERQRDRNPRSRRRVAAAGTTRNTGERAAAHAPAGRNSQPRAAVPTQTRRGGWALAVILLAIIPLAFLLGQQTRASKSEVNAKIEQALDLNRRSAYESAQRTLQRQRNRLQAEFNRRVRTAEQKAYADGTANAQAQQRNSLTDDLKRCIANFLVDC